MARASSLVLLLLASTAFVSLAQEEPLAVAGLRPAALRFEVRRFLREVVEPGQYGPQVTVSFIPGMPPKVLLLDVAGEELTSLMIQTFSYDRLHSFVQSYGFKLKGQDPPAEAEASAESGAPPGTATHDMQLSHQTRLHPDVQLQTEEFPLKERRHDSAARAAQCSLGPGMVGPEVDDSGLPRLNRTRAAQQGAGNVLGGPGPEPSTSSAPSTMMSSYQAMTSGVQGQGPKRSGKKTYQTPGSQGGGLASLVGGGGYANRKDESHLTLGTTKSSPHVPGYAGHIPHTKDGAAFVPRDPNAKSLVVENYLPLGAGYTGRLGR